LKGIKLRAKILEVGINNKDIRELIS